MDDVDITSLSVEISAESQGAELNIDKLATAISNLRTKGSVGKVCTSLDKLSSSIAALKQASAGISGLDKVTNFLNGISSVNTTSGVKGVNSVVNAIKKIPNAVSALNGVDFYSMSDSITQLTNALAPLSILDISGLKSLGSAFKAIGTVPDLTEKLKAADLDSFADSCQRISTALTPLASQLETVGNAFAKLPPQLSKVVTQANRVTAANERQKKSYMSLSSQMNSFMRNMAKLVSLKAIATYLGNAVEKFNSYYEAANLFGVSMKGLTGEASTFINKMETLLGIDPTEAMNNMATIQGLTTSFGMASDKAYILSKNLTQLGYDLASLKNIPVAESFTKIQAAISGELEPIRRLGVDISNARLQQELLNLGYSQSVSTLSQADKAVLRYIAIMKQTTDAQGDFARTLSSPSNMIRILQAQLNSLARSVGSLLYPALKSILPPLIAAVELVKELVTGIASLMGVKVEFPDFSSASDAVGGVTDALDDTTKATGKAAKAFKNYIMGFDELNVIQKNADSSGGSGSGSGAAGNLLGDVDLSGYDMFKQYNEEFAKQIDSIKKKIKDMLPAIGAVTAALALWKIVDFLTDVSTAIAKMTELQKLALSIATVVIEATLVFNFAKGYASTGNPLELLGEIVTAALGSFVLWRTIGADGITLGMGVAFVASLAGLTYALKTGSAKIDSPSTWIQGVLSTVFGSITGITLLTNLGFGGAAAAAVSISLAAIVTLAGITYGATKSGQLLEGSFTDKLLKTVMGVIGAALGAGAALLLGASLPVTGFAAGIGMTLAVIINEVAVKFGKSGNSVDAMSGADAGINKIDAWFQEKVAGLKENWEKSLSSLGEAFSILRLNLDQASADLNDWFVDVGVWWDEKWAGFSTNFQKSWDSLPDYVRHPIKSLNEASDDLNDWFVGVGVWWDEKWKGFKTNWDKAWNSLVDTLKELPQKFLNYGKNIVQGLIDGINKGIESAKKSVSGLAKAILDKFTTDTGIHSPSKVFKGYGGYIVEGLVNGISAAKDLAVKAIQSVSDAVKTVGSQLASENYGLGNGSISLSIDASGKSMMETANALKRSVRTTNDSFGGWFKKMKTDLNDFTEGINAVTDVGKKISQGFNEAIDSLSKSVRSIVGVRDSFKKTVSDIKTFFKSTISNAENKYNYSGGGLSGTFAAIMSVLNDVLTALPNFVTNLSATIAAVETAIKAAKTILPFLSQAKDAIIGIVSTNPELAAVLAIIVAVVGALAMAWKYSEKLRKSIAELFANVKKTAKKLYTDLKKIFEPVADSIRELFNSIGNLLSTIFTTIGDVLASIVKALSPILSALSKILVPAITTIAKVISGVLTIVARILTVVADALSPVIEVIGQILSVIFSVLGDIISAIVTLLQPAIDVVCFAIEGIGTILKSIANIFISIINVMIGGVEFFVNTWIKGINLIIWALNKISIKIPDWVPIIGGQKWGFNLSEVNEVKLPRINKFESGGLPDAGQLFIAREAGAEMVGSMGGHTAVANNDQIVEGIREGVEAAMERQNQLLRRQNELLQALLEKEGSAEINVSSFYQAVNRTNQRNGKTIIPVGT